MGEEEKKEGEAQPVAADQPPVETAPAVGELDESDDESNEGEIPEEERNNGLLDACRENNTEEATKWLELKANALYEKEGWNPLLWAACNGNEEIVRKLIKYGAQDPYIKDVDNKEQSGLNGDGEEDPFRKPEDAKKSGKYTPLHWASYKGHHKVVWILLRIGMSPLKIDQYGNTAVHQATASGNLEVLKCFLARGVNVNKYNGRIHTPMDLATEPETKTLISLARNTKHCHNAKCRSIIDFTIVHFFSKQSSKFF